MGRNFKSVGNWISGWFGHKSSQAAPIAIPQFQTNGPSPNVGNIGTNNYYGGDIIKSTKTATYYRDGSAFFTNELEGYQYMVNRSNMGQRNAIENMGYITKGGVAVIPNKGVDLWGNEFQNWEGHSEDNVKGYMWMGKGKNFTVNFNGKTLKPIAWIHTHPDPLGGYGQSRGDTYTTQNFGIPSVVIGRYSVWYQSVNTANKYQSGYEVMSLNELLSGEIPLIYNLLRLR